MTFDEKVKLLRTLPLFKVAPLAEVRAVAFAAAEKELAESKDYIITQISPQISLILTPIDVNKIGREYPDLAPKLR